MKRRRSAARDAGLPASLPRFESMVRRRLRRGARDYGDASFARPVTDLLDEIEQELADVAGWAAVAFEKLARLRGLAAAVDSGRPGGHGTGPSRRRPLRAAPASARESRPSLVSERANGDRVRPGGHRAPGYGSPWAKSIEGGAPAGFSREVRR